MKQLLFRSAPEGKKRSVDEKTRTATFVAATEGGVETWEGPEHVRVDGVDLARFESNPIVLDSHRRDEAGRIVGRVSNVRVEGRELVTDVVFATTKRAEEVWELVRTGFLRSVSIGFMPREHKVLDTGEVDGEGAARIVGPAVVITKWELLELSVTPLPADQGALLRSAFSLRSDPVKNGIPSNLPPFVPAAGGPAPAPAAPAQPAPTVEPARALGDMPDELRARAREAHRREVLSIAPTHLRDLAETLVLEGVPVEDARKRLLEEHAKRAKPVGTPEPPAPSAPAPVSRVAALDDDSFARAFGG